MSRKYFAPELLFRLRNHIPLPALLTRLNWPHKRREGRWCFVCPQCGESLTAIHPRTNPGRCFRCEINFNAIDLVMCIQDCDFVTAVHFLEPHLPPATPSHARSQASSEAGTRTSLSLPLCHLAAPPTFGNLHRLRGSRRLNESETPCLK